MSSNDPFKETNHGWHRKKRFELIDVRGGKCEECGSDSRLEFAHIKPTNLSGRSRGYNERVLDVRKNPDAYKLLCRRCHRKFDGE